MSKTCFLFFLFLFVLRPSLAQKNRLFNIYLESSKIDFKKPRGYVESDSSITLYDGRTDFRDALSVYNLLSEKDEIFICINFNTIDTAMNSKLRGFPGSEGKPYDANRNYIPYKLPYKTFSSAYAKRYYNADLAGSFDFPVNPKRPVMGKYDKCKRIFIHKENNVDISIFYYYHDNSMNKLKKHMKKTRKMLWFRQ